MTQELGEHDMVMRFTIGDGPLELTINPGPDDKHVTLVTTSTSTVVDRLGLIRALKEFPRCQKLFKGLVAAIIEESGEIQKLRDSGTLGA